MGEIEIRGEEEEGRRGSKDERRGEAERRREEKRRGEEATQKYESAYYACITNGILVPKLSWWKCHRGLATLSHFSGRSI